MSIKWLPGHMGQTRQEVKRPKKCFFYQLQLVLLTRYYLFWGSRWFLSNKYVEGTTLKRRSGLLHLLNLAKTHLYTWQFFKKWFLYHVWCPFMDINIIIFQNIFEYSQSPWYRVSETPPDFEFRSNFTWENLISVKKKSQIFCKVAKLR